MAYRIVQEKYKNGVYKYRVETNNGLFGLRKKYGWWKTCQIPHYITINPAVFDTLEQAENYIEDKTNGIIQSEIIATYN